jgi:hypothetical protein
MADPAEMRTASPRVTSETLAQLIQVFPLPIFAGDLTPIPRKHDASAKPLTFLKSIFSIMLLLG